MTEIFTIFLSAFKLMQTSTLQTQNIIFISFKIDLQSATAIWNIIRDGIEICARLASSKKSRLANIQIVRIYDWFCLFDVSMWEGATQFLTPIRSIKMKISTPAKCWDLCIFPTFRSTCNDQKKNEIRCIRIHPSIWESFKNCLWKMEKKFERF